MKLAKFALTLAGAGALVAAAAAGYAMRHGEVAPISPPAKAEFKSTLIEDGAVIAGLGNCHVCHTRPGGAPYSGGLALPTPFGTIYSTNITPDAATGIGTWSYAAFERAMRKGIDREGRHLYPAFPYDYYTKITDQDLQALYAYLMTLPAVSYQPPETALPFPFNIRLTLEGWNLLFLDEGAYVADASKGEDWNRGAYIVEAMGHCGACHSPRNILGAAAKTGPKAYTGGEAEGWIAPALTAATPAPIPWTENALVNYLIDGWDRDHGIAAGPMKPVVNDLYEQSEDDVFAIAGYLMHLKGGPLPEAEQKAATEKARAFADQVEWGSPSAPPLPTDPQLALGARVYEAQCATCHKSGGQPAPLGLATVVWLDDPANVVRISLEGNHPGPAGSLDRSMPARALQMNDAEMEAVAAFVRARFTTLPPWPADLIARRIAEGREHIAHVAKARTGQ